MVPLKRELSILLLRTGVPALFGRAAVVICVA